MHFKKESYFYYDVAVTGRMYVLINKAELRSFQRRLWWMLDGIGMDGGGFISIYF